ncbi:MAG: glycosyltransferase family 2 protein, partial [Candidatus Omnitrophica bacterium]|nr:glycosyltransferase family 2 protein [Candidatus Omnitrophota bacterium]
MREKLSIVVITKNEEKRIEKYFNNVKWADEIIVIDDNSDDKTAEILEKLGAKVTKNASNGFFYKQRNLGIAKATGDWILQMDADEVIPDDLREEILQILERPTSFSAYSIKRKNFFLGHFMRYGGWYQERTIKLFKKGKAWYTDIGRIHEIIKVDGDIGMINSDIEHYPFDSISQFVERQNYYTSVNAEEILEKRGRLSTKEIKYNIK